jgi:tetratricopeptide (TPR) repeat protein
MATIRARWGLLLPAMLLGSGCATVVPRADRSAKVHATSTPNSSPSDAGVVRTDFQAKLDPAQEVGVHLDLARANEAQGHADAAVAEYERAIAAGERSGHALGGRRPATAQQALVHRRLGGALDRLGRFAEAETHYRAALKLSPDDPKVWNDAGYSDYLQGRLDEAERALKTAAKLAPDDARVRTNLGLVLAASGKTDAALAALTRAGGPAAAHANLAYVLAATGRRDDARAHYRTALQLQPRLDAARVALAQLDADPVPAAAIANRSPATDPSLLRATLTPK